MCLRAEFFNQHCCDFFGRAGEHLRGFFLCGQGDLSSDDDGGGGGGEIGGGELLHFFGFGALDAHQRGVAELVAAGLDGEDGGGGELDGLEPAFFELAFDFEAGVGFFDVQDERGVGQAEEFGDDDACLAEAEVFRLQAGEDEVGVLLPGGGGEQARNAEGVAGGEIVAENVEAAVGALGEGFADGGCRRALGRRRGR